MPHVLKIMENNMLILTRYWIELVFASYFSEVSVYFIFPEVPPVAESYYSKGRVLSLVTLLWNDSAKSIFLWIFTRTPANSYFCTSFKTNYYFLQSLSFLQFSPRHFVPYLPSGFALLPWISGIPCIFYASNSSFCKHNGAIFYQYWNPEISRTLQKG